MLVEHFSRQFTARALATGQVLAAAALSGASFPWAEKFFLRPTPRVWTAVLVTGVLCTAMAFFAQAWAQQCTPATHTALIFSLEPAFAWLTSAVVLGERMGGPAASINRGRPHRAAPT